MYLEIFLVDFAVFRLFLGISRDFAEMPEFRGSVTARNIRSPVHNIIQTLVPDFFTSLDLKFIYNHVHNTWMQIQCK